MFDIVPRMGAFEVSTVFPSKPVPGCFNQITDIMFYSKLLGQMWPNVQSIANRVIRYLDELAQFSVPRFGNNDINAEYLKQKYHHSGRFVKLKRSTTPRLDPNILLK